MWKKIPEFLQWNKNKQKFWSLYKVIEIFVEKFYKFVYLYYTCGLCLKSDKTFFPLAFPIG